MLIRSTAQGNFTRRGAVTVWLLICLLVIMGILAIGMDGGRMLTKRRRAQATADAAALAAATSLFQMDLGTSGNTSSQRSSTAQTAALNLAAANGFNNDGVTSTVSVNTPPASGSFAGQKDYVEVIVQYNLPRTFGAVFTNNSLPVTARAVAVGRPLQLGILLLRQNGSNAFLNQAWSNVTVVNGRVFVNSSDASAFNQGSGWTVSAVTYDVHGNYVNPGGGTIQGQMRTGVRRNPDPLLALPAPDPLGLSVQSTLPLTINSAKTLQPGVYQGGIVITQSATVTMSPGIYIVQGGGFLVNGQATVTGNGVLIYNTSGNLPAGPITISSEGTVTLSPPSSGPYQGVTIFQDRSIALSLIISGWGGTTIRGVVYAPNAAVNLASYANDWSSDTLGGAHICSSMLVKGWGTIYIDPANLPLQVSEIALVE